MLALVIDDGFIFGWSIDFNRPAPFSYYNTAIAGDWLFDSDIISVLNDTITTINPDSTGWNTYTYELIDNFGCAYHYSFPQYVYGIDTVVINSSPTLSSNATGATYQWLDCDNDYSIIEGATEMSFSPTVNGNYAVEIIENGNACIDTTSCVSITTVGLIENKTNDVVVYPNPTNGVFNISLKSDLEEVHITVIDMLGKKVYAKTYANTNSIDLELKQPSGMYFVEVRTKESSKTIRLIKK